MVSIIVPVYNMELYLAETLDSCLQVSSPIEVIVMDDGSTDNSYEIACAYAKRDHRVRAYRQTNAGVAVARNHAIRLARGEYIFPLDADDCIAPDFLKQAEPILAQKQDVSVVGGRTLFIGDRSGEWVRPDFSHALLARKNMLPASCLYRKADWERIGGYCEEEIYREDWDFWLSVFELGGRYVELPEVSFYYRIRPASRRTYATRRTHKRQMIDMLNRRHAAYFHRYLGGPLRYHRSWSRWLNHFYTEVQVGTCSDWYAGRVIHGGRNTVRVTKEGVIKDFQRPNLWKSVLYGFFRKTKARRSYEYALRLEDIAPKPLAYREVRFFGFLKECQYLSEYQSNTVTYAYVMEHPEAFDIAQIIREVALLTARLHNDGILHTDYSRGNLLFDLDTLHIWMVDLNRLRWGCRVTVEEGIDNLSRLHEVTPDDVFAVLCDTYRQART